MWKRSFQRNQWKICQQKEIVFIIHFCSISVEVIINSMYQEKPENHLVGWLVISSKKNNKLKDKLRLGIDSFYGDYGKNHKIIILEQFGIGLRIPEQPLSLTTWSYFENTSNVCFIEGTFYENYKGYDIKQGDDPQFAKIFLKHFCTSHKKSLEYLNGSFSGFVLDKITGHITTFVDRLGVKTVYSSNINHTLVISSNLAVFRAFIKPELDSISAFQFLTIGHPIGERTLVKDVFIQQPCTMIVHGENKKKTIRFWKPPERQNNLSLAESVEMISNAMENSLYNIYKRTKDSFALGITGGHDSRIIASALKYKGIPFQPIMWKDNTFNDRVAPIICSLIDKKPVLIKKLTDFDLENIKNDNFVYSDGNFLHSWGFTALAKESRQNKLEYLISGFTGDILSGSTTSPTPHSLKSIKKLIKYSLLDSLELLSFKQCSLLLNMKKDDSQHITETEWEESFLNESLSSNLTDISIWQQLKNINFRRVRFAMFPGQQYAQLIFPYLHSTVLNTYFSLPINYIHDQKAHCYAGFFRYQEFGDHQACNYPISLKREAQFSSIVPHLRNIRSKVIPKIKHLFSYNSLNEYQNNILSEISKNSIINSSYLKELSLSRKFNSTILYKIHTLCRFNAFYIDGYN